jgi:hypothetical protein
MLNEFFDNIFQGRISKLSKDRGLSYTLVYNLAHGRIHTLSARDYKIIFGEDPPLNESDRVDGKYFRQMVKLWLFLNDDVTEADLYREFYPRKKFSRVDYRIFTGDVKTVPSRFEKLLEKKFLDQGFQQTEIKQYIEELSLTSYNDRIFYNDLKPTLEYLENKLDVHPGRILNQFPARYESGELITVPQRVYEYARRLRKKTDNALKSGSKFEIEKLKEDVYGKRAALTLFSAVEDELEFLKNNGGRKPKYYLERSISLYKKSKLKRIASWRAQRIKEDCLNLIKQKPDLSISCVPKPYLSMVLANLFSVLTIRFISLMSEDKDCTFERSVLEPSSSSREDYRSFEQKNIGMNKAAHVLRMSRKAFDLMVANHRDIFRGIGIYEKKWHIPDLYLRELLRKEGFHLIKAKYEFLAKNGHSSLRQNKDRCRPHQDSNEVSSQQISS